jgi:hypothetical protein
MVAVRQDREERKRHASCREPVRFSALDRDLARIDLERGQHVTAVLAEVAVARGHEDESRHAAIVVGTFEGRVNVRAEPYFLRIGGGRASSAAPASGPT